MGARALLLQQEVVRVESSNHPCDLLINKPQPREVAGNKFLNLSPRPGEVRRRRLLSRGGVQRRRPPGKVSQGTRAKWLLPRNSVVLLTAIVSSWYKRLLSLLILARSSRIFNSPCCFFYYTWSIAYFDYFFMEQSKSSLTFSFCFAHQQPSSSSSHQRQIFSFLRLYLSIRFDHQDKLPYYYRIVCIGRCINQHLP
jgi:hypothetical protein